MSPFLFISLGFILNMILVSDAFLSVWKFKFEIFLLIKTASWEYLPPLRDSYQEAERDREEKKAGLKFPPLSTNESACHMKTTNDWENFKMINFQSIFLRLTAKKSRSRDNITVLNKNIASCPAIIFPLLVR